MRRGNESEAEANYKRVLAIKEKTTGAESKEVAQTLFRLAEMYQSRGEFEKAVPLYQRLLKFDDECLSLKGISPWKRLGTASRVCYEK